ncbi:hypothetical protein C1A38_02495 [Verrucosispora sp. ts21]|uniref:DUF6924 domain-containing protein n=1 Tax=Verrucosispora sp. ts21 TaxID=2069341 RepID=UPI000C88BBD3|nr:hypothetical protein [Verrucosispora sp. ts21]PMR62641.1 hypothetical protein C1A38_02495 [Verrucosispora sp. ts21]
MPSSNTRDDLSAVIIRTDYSDEATWQTVRRELQAGDRSGLLDGEDLDGEVAVVPPLIVEDPAWAGASVDDVLAAIGDDDLAVVFIADAATLADPEYKLLAVAVTSGLDPQEAETILEFGREFRIVPGWIEVFNSNLALGNMDFDEYAEVARATADGAFRGFLD